jgi:hypothetical protein
LPSLLAAICVGLAWAVSARRGRVRAFRVALAELFIALVATVVLVAIEDHLGKIRPGYTAEEAPLRELLDLATRAAFLGLALPSTALLGVSSGWRAIRRDGALFAIVSVACVLLVGFMLFLLVIGSVSGGMIG